MKITIIGTIVSAWQRTINGEGTSYELNIGYNNLQEDIDGMYTALNHISIPLDSSRTEEEIERMIDKNIKVTVEIN